MFIGQTLSKQASSNTVLLANPPFDNFTPEGQSLYLQKKPDLRFLNKAAEMLWRTVAPFPEGAVFGVVLPQARFRWKNSEDIRQFLLRHVSSKDLAIFRQNVFFFGCGVGCLLGRRQSSAKHNAVRYRRIRERELASFRADYPANGTRFAQKLFEKQRISFRIPDLEGLSELLSETRNSLMCLSLAKDLCPIQHLYREWAYILEARVPTAKRDCYFLIVEFNCVSCRKNIG